jgi:hypothetical protein
MLESKVQLRKVELLSSSIVDGIEIDFNDEQLKKTEAPRCDSFDPDSKVKSNSEEQPLKQEL